MFAFAWGIGGATVSDMLFFNSIKDKKVSKEELGTLETASKVVIGGITLAILSGAAMLYFQYLNTGGWPLLETGRFQTKVTLVLLVALNGFVFHKAVFPILKRNADKPLNDSEEVKSKLWLFSATGAVSFVSWYGAALLAFWKTIGFSYLELMNIYLVLVFGAMAVGHLMLSLIIFSTKSDVERIKKGLLNSKMIIAFILAAVLIFVGFMMFGSAEEGKTHYVCITETPPWFTPDVLEINKGDTVVWEHCDEDDVHSSVDTSIIIKKSFAHGDDGEYVHTHPILSISGPEAFSSGLRVVGHLSDGNDFRYTFTKEGAYEYICPTHPYMKGIITVGTSSPKESLWPPDEIIKPSLLSPPEIFGVGEVWVNTQFERVEGQKFPGTITIINAETWEIEEVISHPEFNNPHNLWNSSDGQFIYQTQWHSDLVHKIDVSSREVVGSVRLGNAPAHLFVHPYEDKIYVTLNNENRVVILNSDLDILGNIETSFGPHGIWIDPSGAWMSVAATLEEKLNIIDLRSDEVVATFDAPGLPLATQITNDGRYAMISLLFENKVRFVDLETLEYVKDVEVGGSPIWAMPDPNNEYVFVPNTGTADISVISLESLEVVKTIPAASGAHGIIFGPKQGGGYYGYFSNKFARVVGVVDLDTLETVGYIELGEGQWGGNGILTLPNPYDDFITE